METDKPRKSQYGSFVRAQYNFLTNIKGDFDLLMNMTF